MTRSACPPAAARTARSEVTSQYGVPAAAYSHAAPEAFRLECEYLSRQRRFQDPGLLVELGLELAGAPARVPRVETGPPRRSGEEGRVGARLDETDVGEDERGRLVGVVELGED